MGDLMDDEQLVADYLRRLGDAAQGLPPGQRDALVAQTAARIAEARVDGPQRGTAMASVHLMTFLERLGEPGDLVRPPRSRHRARGDSGRRGSGTGTGTGTAAAQRASAGGHEVAAVVLLLIGGLLAGIGWLVGVLLLWTSPRWRLGDKVLGTLIWPGGIAAALAGPAVLFVRQIKTGPVCTTVSSQQLCPTSAPTLALPGWLFVLLLVVGAFLAVGGPVWMATRLMRRARETPPGVARAAEDRLAVESGA
jgi:hypothetical protein